MMRLKPDDAARVHMHLNFFLCRAREENRALFA